MLPFADADYATSKAGGRRSDTGEVILCGGAASCCIMVLRDYNVRATLSTMEAEYAALSDVLKKVLLLRQAGRFMVPRVGRPCIAVFEDNQGALLLVRNPIITNQF